MNKLNLLKKPLSFYTFFILIFIVNIHTMVENLDIKTILDTEATQREIFEEIPEKFQYQLKEDGFNEKKEAVKEFLDNHKQFQALQSTIYDKCEDLKGWDLFFTTCLLDSFWEQITTGQLTNEYCIWRKQNKPPQKIQTKVLKIDIPLPPSNKCPELDNKLTPTKTSVPSPVHFILKKNISKKRKTGKPKTKPFK